MVQACANGISRTMTSVSWSNLHGTFLMLHAMLVESCQASSHNSQGADGSFPSPYREELNDSSTLNQIPKDHAFCVYYISPPAISRQPAPKASGALSPRRGVHIPGSQSLLSIRSTLLSASLISKKTAINSKPRKCPVPSIQLPHRNISGRTPSTAASGKHTYASQDSSIGSFLFGEGFMVNSHATPTAEWHVMWSNYLI